MGGGRLRGLRPYSVTLKVVSFTEAVRIQCMCIYSLRFQMFYSCKKVNFQKKIWYFPLRNFPLLYSPGMQ